MHLAKDRLDVGLFTDDAAAQRDFWADRVGLGAAQELEIEPGWVQHRFDAHGSVIKVNHLARGVPPAPPSGVTAVTVAADRDGPWTGEHPGGGTVSVIGPGGDVTGIGITLSSPDPERLVAFYRDVLDFEATGPLAVRCGQTPVAVVEGPGGSPTDDVVGPGYRYLTVQVHDVDREIDEVLRRGGRLLRAPAFVAGVARIGFVADPDGTWIELSARASLTGIRIPS
jgi:lactoylglutathione lyase